MCVNTGEMLDDTVVALGVLFGHMYRDIGPDVLGTCCWGQPRQKFGSESTSLKVALSRAQPPSRVYDTKDLDYGRASNNDDTVGVKTHVRKDAKLQRQQTCR